VKYFIIKKLSKPACT